MLRESANMLTSLVEMAILNVKQCTPVAFKLVDLLVSYG